MYTSFTLCFFTLYHKRNFDVHMYVNQVAYTMLIWYNGVNVVSLSRGLELLLYSIDQDNGVEIGGCS